MFVKKPKCGFGVQMATLQTETNALHRHPFRLDRILIISSQSSIPVRIQMPASAPGQGGIQNEHQASGHESEGTPYGITRRVTGLHHR